MKVAIVYWSGTGNTEMMADKVMEGVQEAGGDAEKFTVADFDVSTLDDYDAFAFGCPAMGSENLEEGEFQPFWDSIKERLGDKKVGLFGSYGWGSGDWMINWAEEAKSVGIHLVNDGVKANYTPDDDALNACVELGKALVD